MSVGVWFGVEPHAATTPFSGPDVARMLADRVKKLSHELFDELVTQVPDATDNLGKVEKANVTLWTCSSTVVAVEHLWKSRAPRHKLKLAYMYVPHISEFRLHN